MIFDVVDKVKKMRFKDDKMINMLNDDIRKKLESQYECKMDYKWEQRSYNRY